MIRDCMERWDGKDHDRLVGLFVQSVLDNVNGAHSVRYLEERHDNGDGTYETDFLVEVTFTNSYGAMCEIDHALESMNGRDFRMVCDKFVKTALDKAGALPDLFDWPTPDARVTYDWFEDEDDVTKTVTVTWAVDEKTWRRLNQAARPKKPELKKPELKKPEHVYLHYRDRENEANREIVNVYRKMDDAVKAVVKSAEWYAKECEMAVSDLSWHVGASEMWWANEDALDSDGIVVTEMT